MGTAIRWIARALAFLAMGAALAQEPAAEPRGAQAEIDSVLAPIALYPDDLLAQMLAAATYPLEVVQAARWSRAHPELNGEAAVRAAQGESWDASVKSMVAFPEVLAMMDQRLDWTQRLGEAFLADRDGAMRAVQRLRRAAWDRDYLRSGDEMVVARQDDDITIEPAAPDVTYVPYYDPNVVYGPWWWPESPPAYWDPWPGYYFGPSAFIAFSVGIPIARPFFFACFDWRRHYVRHGDHEWRHDPRHRHGVDYRNPLARPGRPGGAQPPVATAPQGFFPPRPLPKPTPPAPVYRYAKPTPAPSAPRVVQGAIAPQAVPAPAMPQPFARGTNAPPAMRAAPGLQGAPVPMPKPGMAAPQVPHPSAQAPRAPSAAPHAEHAAPPGRPS